MNFFDSFAPADELPLECPVPVGGGMCSIFRAIGCVGDSLASGEFEVRLPPHRRVPTPPYWQCTDRPYISICLNTRGDSILLVWRAVRCIISRAAA